jgi:hypothetical protein
MTSSLRSGACWGLSITWLRDCFAADPSAAGVGLTQGTNAHEALIAHDDRANQFVSGASDDNNISNGVFMISKGKFDASRDTLADGAPSASAGIALSKAMSITSAMSSIDGDYHGMIVIAMAQGRHAMAVARCQGRWALFDPNAGTWVYTGNGGAPVQFSSLLKDVFESYRVSAVSLFKLTNMY